MVFLRILGFECDIRGNRSANRDIARDGVMMCGNVIKGREMVGIDGELMS